MYINFYGFIFAAKFLLRMISLGEKQWHITVTFPNITQQ